MIFHGELIKYSMCNEVVRLLNVARSANEMPVLPIDLIEGHEFCVPDLEVLLRRVARRTKNAQGYLVREIAQESGKPVLFVKSLMRGLRTTEGRCLPVRDAMHALYGEHCTVSADLVIDRSARREDVRRRAIKAIPPIMRGV